MMVVTKELRDNLARREAIARAEVPAVCACGADAGMHFRGCRHWNGAPADYKGEQTGTALVEAIRRRYPVDTDVED